MCWRKWDLWKAGIMVVGVLLFLMFIILIPVSAVVAYGSASGSATLVTVQATPTVDATVTVLTKEKLVEDVAQEQHTFANWFWNNAAALLSTLVFVVGALIGFLRWVHEQRTARLRARRDAEAARELAQLAAQGERELAVDNQRETSLQAYIDKMSELLLKEGLRESAADREVRQLARVRTLTVLPQLDPSRKKSIIRFLYESGLINTHNTIIDLSYANLREAGLHRATLTGINLSKTNLRYADLSESELDQANLSAAKLEGTNLTQARLVGANLNGILDFEHIESMEDANLRGVTGLTKEQLEACKAKGAIVDEDTAAVPSRPPAASPTPSAQLVTQPPLQNTNSHAPAASPAQVNTPPPSTDGSSSTPSQPSTGP